MKPEPPAVALHPPYSIGSDPGPGRVGHPAQRQNRLLPVWRARWANGVAVYADPASARIVLRADNSNRWQRLLYNGLHSFDFAPLLARPWLRDGLIVVLPLLGVAMSIRACKVAWRAFMPRQRRRSQP